MTQQHSLKDGRVLAIGRANPADAAEILQFLRVSAGESDNLSSGPGDFTQTVQRQAAWLAEQAARHDAVSLCGKVEGHVMAMAELQTPSLPRIAHTGEVSLLVARAFWGQGAGSALLGALLGFARGNGRLKLLHLKVRADNARAMALYGRFGFAECGRYHNFFYTKGQYCDEVLMEQWL